MGTIIKSVAVAKPFFRGKILSLTVQSVKHCLKNSGIEAQHIGMLVNTSVYSENHLGEPALASLIQKNVQFNPFQKKKSVSHSGKMFSFDLHCGGGGAIAAFQLIDDFLQTGEIQNGLVVAGDVKPVTGRTENFSYSPGAAAVLLSKTDENIGFDSFRNYTYPDFINDLESTINWNSGKFRFAIHQRKEFLINCVSCALVSVHQFFKEKNLCWEQIDLVITSQNPAGFISQFKKETGIKNKVAEVNENSNFYSAGLFFSLNKVFKTHRFTKAKNILFVTVGAGIIVSLSLYKN
jgi:3-oxoacyl-[acyl-carrier-protein] synthase III